MRRSILLRVGLLFSCATAFVQAQLGTSLFGVSHFPIGSASIDDVAARVLEVSDIGESGQDGVRTELGATDSGAFLFPSLEQVQSGYAMRGEAFGTVGRAADRRIGMVSGYRADYATFYATADYTPLGANSLTFQLWHGNVMVAETTTVTNGEVKIYAEYSAPPRVNPWWTQANGEHGASIEFFHSGPPTVTLPGAGDPSERPGYITDRIFIRPNGITNSVDSVSRTDVYASGGITAFRYYDLRLGMFAHAHEALANTTYSATNGTLRIDLPSDTLDGDNGVAVEFEHAASTAVRLAPFDLVSANTNTALFLRASGTRRQYVNYLGQAVVENSNGVLLASAYMEYATGFVATVYQDGISVGSLALTNGAQVEITGQPRLVSTDTTADSPGAAFSLGFGFDRTAVFNLPGGAVEGNSLVFGSTNGTFIADITAVALSARAATTFTIVGETSTSAYPQLAITRSEGQVTLRWPDPAQAFAVNVKHDLSESWTSAGVTPTYENGFASVTVPVDEAWQFFRLESFSYAD